MRDDLSTRAAKNVADAPLPDVIIIDAPFCFARFAPVKHLSYFVCIIFFFSSRTFRVKFLKDILVWRENPVLWKFVIWVPTYL